MIQTAEAYYPLYENKDKFIILVTGGRGCEHPDTPVMMADLTVKAIKDIVVGDKVMGDDGTPRTVLDTTHGYGQMYKVHQTSAEDYIVNDAHILTVKRSMSAKLDKGELTRNGTYRRPNGRYPNYGDGDTADINVLDFENQSKRFREHFRGFKSSSIPYAEQSVDIPPYLLGLWLGDGTAIFPSFTNPEPEIEDYLADYCNSVGLKLTRMKNSSGCPHFRLSGDGSQGGNVFLNALKEYYLIGNKHIPQCYISNSENVRLELLAGLLDTDGSISKDRRKVYDITQKSEMLARQIKFVADTLGFRTSIHAKEDKINGVTKGVYYRVTISGDLWRIPCKVSRKKVAERDLHKNKDWHLSQLAIEPLGIGEWNGICLDGNQRYLHADGTVTHNSGKSFSLGAFIERLTFETGVDDAGRVKPHVILYTRYTMTNASISVIPEVKEKIDLDGTAGYFHITKNDIINNLTGGRIMFRGIRASSGNQTAKLKSIQGITTFVCDEAEEFVDEEAFDKLVLSIRQKGIQNRVIIIMNPTDSNHFIYRRYIENTHRIVEYDGVPVQISTHPEVLHIHTSYLNNREHLSEQYLENIERMRREQPDKYAHVVMGQWASAAEGAVFKDWGIVDEFPPNAKKVAAGLDLGYSNDVSACVKCGIVGNDLYLDEQFYQTGMLASDLIRELKKIGLFVYSDSADPRLIQEISNGGVIIYPVAKPPGSVIAGIDRIKDFDHIFVTRNSYNIQNELRNYVWAKDKDGRYINYPEDHDNHACFTADTLVETDKGGKQIKDLWVGDNILTSMGYRKLKVIFDNGIRKIWRVRLSFDDTTIEMRVTPDHKIKTIQGWEQVQKLGKGDILYLYRNLTENSISQRSMPPSMQKSTETTQNSLKCPKGFAAMAVLRSITVLEENFEHVYDLNVDEIHEYFANGLLVSNCDGFRYYVNGCILGNIVKPRQYNPSNLGIY